MFFFQSAKNGILDLKFFFKNILYIFLIFGVIPYNENNRRKSLIFSYWNQYTCNNYNYMRHMYILHHNRKYD